MPQNARWVIVAAGLLILLGLGSVYSWSVFRADLEKELGLNATQSLLPYTFALVFYAALMPVAGHLIGRIGPRRVVLLGALLVASGYFLAAVAQSAWNLALAYGVFAGSGVGFAYGVPLAVAARWFPGARGLAIGITVIGFGVSPLVTAPLGHWLVESIGIRAALACMGAGIFGIVLACSAWMKFPAGSESQKSSEEPATPHQPLLSSLFHRASFYGLWLCFALGTFCGLSVIGISVSVGREVFALDAAKAAGFLSLFALANGISRPLCGWLVDHFAPWKVALLLFGLLFFASTGIAWLHGHGVAVYAVGFCLLWFCLGGWLATAPATTSRLFPLADYARNYGVVFTAYGAGALSGTLATGLLRDATGSYLIVFPILSAVSIIGMLLAAGLLREKRAI